MGLFQGRVTEIRMAAEGGVEARIACPSTAQPRPGQYLAARDRADPYQVLALPLFLAEATTDGFIAAPPYPTTWGPGSELELRGPLGRGFQLPDSIRRLGLLALGETSARLLPLAHMVLAQDGAVALFTDLPLPDLPRSIEVFRLEAASEALAWADFLAIDLPLSVLPQLRQVLHWTNRQGIPCPAQALINTCMPCQGEAACGACAVPARHGWKLACLEGPVFDLQQLEW